MRNSIATGIIILCTYAAQCHILRQEPALSPLDVAIVENNDLTHDIMALRMPINLNMGIDLVQSATPLSLQLKLMDNKNELRNVYVPRTDMSGRKMLRKENIPIHNNVGFYQDLNTGAACKVTCEGLSQGHCDPLLAGSFNVGGVEYAIQMIQGDPGARVKRSVRRRTRGRNKPKGRRLYKVFKTKRHMASMSDYMDAGDIMTGATCGAGDAHSSGTPDLTFGFCEGRGLNSVGNIMQNSGQHNRADTLATTNSRTGALRQSDSVVDLNHNSPASPMALRNTGHARLMFATPTEKGLYHLGLLLVIDYNIYKKFFDETSRENTFFERDEEAKSDIREHMANIANGVDLRFNNFETYDIKVVITGYVIIDKVEDSRWSQQRIAKLPRDLLNASIALSELFEWKKDFRRDLPPHDHVMLFTQYDLYVNSFSDVKVAGFAHIKAICKDKGLSVVEDEGGFDNILTATHELAHSLGASHDGDVRYNNHCDPNDGFIMTAVGGGTAGNPAKGQNSYKFSTCSEEQINNYIETLGPGHCLENEDAIYDTDEFDSHVSLLLGQKYDPNEQCTLNLGYPSYYAWGGRLGEPHEICTSMACKNRLSSESFNIFNGYRGTSCGDKKWCINGVCTHAQFAPGKSDVCVHGDSQRKFGRQRDLTCKDFVTAEPFRCYDPFYSTFCCRTCADLKGVKQDCEYGDRNTTECAMLKTRKDLCYIEANSALCCDTCGTHFTGIDGCEYGDHYRQCNPNDCDKPENAKFCCETCAGSRPRSGVRMSPGISIPVRRTWMPAIPNTTKPPVRTTPTRRRFPPQIPQRAPARRQPPISRTDVLFSDKTIEWCVKEKAKFFQASCSWLDKWLRGICKNNFFRSSCCQQCPPKKPPISPNVPIVKVTKTDHIRQKKPTLPLHSPKKEVKVIKIMSAKPVCIDEDLYCLEIDAFECYTQSTRTKCCAACESLRTNIPDCPFGNKNSQCAPMFKLNPDYTCTQKRSLCCYTCRGVVVPTVGRPVLPMLSNAEPQRHVQPSRQQNVNRVGMQMDRRKETVGGRRWGRGRDRQIGKPDRVYGAERAVGRDAATQRFRERQQRLNQMMSFRSQRRSG